jgi:hypothetical protein
MGAWGHGNWENDDASDWAIQLEESNDTALLKQTLSKVMSNSGYLEAPDCCEALASAEVVAALKGAFGKDLPEKLKKWASQHSAEFTPELSALALQAVGKIKSDSELKELWEESGPAPEWFAVLENLEKRLA